MLQYWGGVLKKKFVKFVVQDLTSGGLLGVWGKRVKHAKYIYNIQDFNPEQVLVHPVPEELQYLKRVLGIEVLYENKALEHLPNFISTRYDSQKVSLSGQKAVFLYPKTELEQVETLKKHLERVKKVADCPVVLVLEQITARQKEYLLREKIAFIVDGKQIYCRNVVMQKRATEKKSCHQLKCCCFILFMREQRNCPQVKLQKIWI